MNASLKVLALGALCGFSAATLAQNYPVKPVRIMVGVAPGGGVDTTARMLGQALGELWGTPVIIENRTGAVGMVATEFTAKAPPDGYIAIHIALDPRLRTRANIWIVTNELVIVVIEVHLPAKLKLFQIVQTGGSMTLATRLAQRREKHGRKNCNNGDDDQQLDQGERQKARRWNRIGTRGFHRLRTWKAGCISR